MHVNRLAVTIQTVDPRTSRTWPEKSKQQSQQGRLASPIGPQQAEDLTGVDRERAILERRHATVGLAQ
jgi:hypothetical protein